MAGGFGFSDWAVAAGKEGRKAHWKAGVGGLDPGVSSLLFLCVSTDSMNNSTMRFQKGNQILKRSRDVEGGDDATVWYFEQLF